MANGLPNPGALLDPLVRLESEVANVLSAPFRNAGMAVPQIPGPFSVLRQLALGLPPLPGIPGAGTPAPNRGVSGSNAVKTRYV